MSELSRARIGRPSHERRTGLVQSAFICMRQWRQILSLRPANDARARESRPPSPSSRAEADGRECEMIILPSLPPPPFFTAHLAMFGRRLMLASVG